ncbi:MAG: endonuclease/exonuclease/phosphatase family protein [Proteobacteria bacterium]|nr:endonuclease/exonuclease/phosphatase family protein [Pseudomonadota bacterium]
MKPAAPTRRRVVTLNLWQEQGPWERRLALTAERLAALRPDVVCLQEVRQVPGRVPNQAETLAAALGLAWTYETAQPWGGGDEGLAILGRGRLVQRHCSALPGPADQTRRIVLGAALEFADGAACWVFTTHLAYRLTDGAVRERQVQAVDRFVRDSSEGPALLCGDFNAVPESDEIRYLTGMTSIDGARTYYQDAFALCHPGERGWTWSSDNPYTPQLSTLPADRRLDYIFVTPRRKDGRGRIRSCELACDQADATGVHCSDHHAVVADVDL